jgi:E3 ubiquitin ligase SMURF1/2/E3 ubiquitin-protein ligase NEDD4
MCGTSKQFTIDYKQEKKDKYLERIRLKKTLKANKTNGPQDIKIYDNIVSQSQSINFQYDGSRKSEALSELDRFTALNYRRLNALSLRQKGARRRRMWQRVVNEETGELTWVRQNAKETKVGDSNLCYSPRESLIGSPVKGQSMSFFFGSRNKADKKDILETPTSTPIKSRKAIATPRDSFDETLISGSPGFTSVFGDDGELKWEKIESGTAASKSILPVSPELPEDFHIDLNDTHSAMALNFKEKQLWFLRHLSNLQRPWEEGCIRILVDRSDLLNQSFEQVRAIMRNELHRYMRIMFIGEPGIDAGGLAREWFSLVMDAIFAPETGLFTSTSGIS